MATPRCGYFNLCGGCSSQHIDYTTQLQNKKKFLENAIGFDGIKVFSDKEYGYRNRIELIFRRYGDKNVCGFRIKGSPDNIMDIDGCPICYERINKLIKEIKSHFKDADFYDSRKKKGTFLYAIVRVTSHSSGICFVLNDDSSAIGHASDKIKSFNTSADNVCVTFSDDKGFFSDHYEVKGSLYIKESLDGKDFLFPLFGFFQNNTAIASKIQEYIRSILTKDERNKEMNLLDLYAGVGTFGINNSSSFKEVHVVESFKESIDAAEINIKNNNCSNVKTVLLDADKIKKLDIKGPLIVITDPPRTGMSLNTIDTLNRLSPEKILYISCNPLQLSKELTRFPKYKISSAALFDMFPQTNHSEAVILLQKHQFSVGKD
jgi:23S rRNA (uracil-5-)-methyltransferase RumA